jgi:hypothetical protein
VRRALKNQLILANGIAYLDGVPFSGLAFDIDNDSEAIRITFYDVTLSCHTVRAIESYSDGKRGGDFAPVDIELKYMESCLAFLGAFPDDAEDLPAEFSDTKPFSGIIYTPDLQRGWEARLYANGSKHIKMAWYTDGVPEYAVAYAPIYEYFHWYKDGSPRQCWIHNGGTFNVQLGPDGRLLSLTLKNWRSMLRNTKRKLPFRCAGEFPEILKYRSAPSIWLDFDDEVAKNVPDILNSGLLDDAEIIRWNGVVATNAMEELFASLSKNKLKKVICGSHESAVGEFCIMLKKRIPNLEIVSTALNMRSLKLK